ncbi:hypothetical protein AzCIB_0167 [Azoarcus sp. CIB]|uniref:hypothetical protein n=1 Tax=Aromatoleum sp. (strain CIB) TaxID=198107 RepID=UPI00067C482C|nr:hypothetical protein [Azoarcus sp. CIB]AKU10072.1 hypothetical protein AzCIB_0167 [Azoarcus sp. CIB]
MAKNIRTLVAIASLPLMVGVASASGPYAGSCGASLDAVETAIVAATFYDPKAASNESNMILKLDSAAAKLGQSKPLDAIANLESISDRATELATAPKPKLDDAAGINAAAASAITCVGANY